MGPGQIAECRDVLKGGHCQHSCTMNLPLSHIHARHRAPVTVQIDWKIRLSTVVYYLHLIPHWFVWPLPCVDWRTESSQLAPCHIIRLLQTRQEPPWTKCPRFSSQLPWCLSILLHNNEPHVWPCLRPLKNRNNNCSKMKPSLFTHWSNCTAEKEFTSQQRQCRRHYFSVTIKLRLHLIKSSPSQFSCEPLWVKW
jgi:hypothetical protein